MFGIDEAGRGPAIGSLFIALVSGPYSSLPDGMADSKQLQTSEIHAIADRILANSELSAHVIEVTASEIDDSPISLTDLTIDAMKTLIAHTDIDGTGYIDAPHTDPSAVSKQLDGAVSSSHIQLICEHRADETYPHTQAASIIAKSWRERHIERLHKRHGDFGSGYPGDDMTIKYIEDTVQNQDELPPIIRTSWQTVQTALSQAQQTDFSDYN